MTDTRHALPYGLWPSPISPQSLAESLRLSDVAWDSDGATLVWLEGRSDRGVLVCLPPGGEAPRDVTPEVSVRARVGYGGGDFSVAAGQVYFGASNGRLYRQALDGGVARPLTPGFGAAAAPTVSPDQRWVVFVHTYEERDVLAIVDTAGQAWPQQLVRGADFYMQPCWHPQGTWLAWVEWDHPQMPWEGARLCLGQVRTEAGALPQVHDSLTLAGSPTVSIFQPAFSPDGRFLAYICNQSGWGQLMLYDLAAQTHRALTSAAAECGQPAWAQGMRTYGWRHDSQGLYYLQNSQGFRRLWYYDLQRDRPVPHEGLAAYTWLDQPAIAPTHAALACIASSPTIPPRVVTLALDTPSPARSVRRSAAEHVPAAALSTPQALTWASTGGVSVHGLYYPPSSAEYQSSGPPPAVVLLHGGPTAQAVAAYHAQTQFLTTRGYAVLQVNYRGSTGYGTAYVDALRGQWGVADVEDAVSGAQALVAQGLAAASQLVMMGGSAGGYTVLQALAQHPGLFKAALCLYGIANLFTLAATTHKFEAHYLDSLIGPLPDAAALYRERSPLFAADRIRDPIALFQGEDDQVVSKAQAEALVASLARRGVPHAYHVYAREGHGWRKAETITHFYTTVEAFLRQYVVFA